MNGNGDSAVVDKNGNGISKIEPSILDSTEEGKNATAVVGIKEDFLEPDYGPKPGGISKMKSTMVDVIVQNAVGPHNFIIQDYRQSENLKRLEKSMTEFYTEYCKRSTELDHFDIIAEGYYAANIESKEDWVRVHVVKPFSLESPQIMVYLLDHGSYDMTDAAHLRPLRRIYVDKLPSQAYRAKLHFMSAAGTKWEPEECTRFRSDVEGKPFCAIIVDEAKDSRFSDEIPVFSLVLIDTSGPQDRYVHQSYARKR